MGTSSNPTGDRRAMEHLDADAVCAQCGTVNIEETLICKTCGNNLRDQRQLRLTAEAQMEGEIKSDQRRQFIRGALAVLGLLIVLWTALNVQDIQQWMISAQTEYVNPAEELFFGASAAVYGDMTEELRANLPSNEEIDAALAGATPAASYPGYYIIIGNDGGEGTALLRPAAPAEGDTGTDHYDFVALFEDIEVRGVAMLRGNNMTADWSSTGVDYLSDYVPASGVVIQQANGSFDGFGKLEGMEAGVSFTAFKLAR